MYINLFKYFGLIHTYFDNLVITIVTTSASANLVFLCSLTNPLMYVLPWYLAGVCRHKLLHKTFDWGKHSISGSEFCLIFYNTINIQPSPSAITVLLLLNALLQRNIFPLIPCLSACCSLCLSSPVIFVLGETGKGIKQQPSLRNDKDVSGALWTS